MPLVPLRLGAALDETLTLHSALCRREAVAFQKAAISASKSGETLVVACTQESRLFVELAEQTEGVSSSASGKEQPIKFVNIRETGGWGQGAAQAMPKIAALLAAAHLPLPEPVATVTFKSAGRLLVIGPLDEAERLAGLLDDALNVTLFATGPGQAGGGQERRFPVLAGRIESLTGWLGAFELTHSQNNPIDLDVCTRCNACLSVCPEGAIGLDYQIDSQRCNASRKCVQVCEVAGAIDFGRIASSQSDMFDLVLDLRPAPALNTPDATHFSQHSPPLGYLRWAGDYQALFDLRDKVGEFEKPKFFAYRQKVCAHTRNQQVGCSACVDVCSAKAIRSDMARQQITVNPNLCVGCGACTTVCPTGALTYAYPRASDQGLKLKTLLTTYAQSGGRDAAILLHSQDKGSSLVDRLGRAAQLGRAADRQLGHPAPNGVPARVVPVPLWHTASTGLDIWLTALAYGAAQVWVLVTDEESPNYVAALETQMEVAQAIMTGLGYSGQHLAIIETGIQTGRKAGGGPDVTTLDQALKRPVAQAVGKPASFAIQTDKRATLDLAIDHLLAQSVLTAAQLPPEIPLPSKRNPHESASPFGSLVINKDACTLCLSCVSACPSAALQDNPLSPQLKFIEKNCVQCGLCATTCPEQAITLQPRLLLGKERKEARVLNEAQPFACIRCSKPFGTLKGIESMLGKLGGHAMFQGDAFERLKMCSDCRVIDLYSATNETRITDL